MSLYRLVLECSKKQTINANHIEQIASPIFALAGDLTKATNGEVAVPGCVSLEDYRYIQPIKTATLAMTLGKSCGILNDDLGNLGMAAVLKDVGYIAIPPEVLNKPELLTESDIAKIRKHPTFGYELLRQHESTSQEVANAVLQHHERWNGSGYPYGLKGADISLWAQIIAICDTFTALLSDRPGRRTYMPNEAVEYVMGYSGKQFNPDLVKIFVKQVPCYPSGLGVQLETGEMGIVSNPNLDFVGRPVIRVCYNTQVGPVKKPYTINLAEADHQQKVIVKVLDYT
jgi:HD-GYP domain-containing protein (c-di-GMP phosphodiesterase class II)